MFLRVMPAAGLFATALLLSAPEQVQAQPDFPFAGEWQLDADESDDPREAMQATRRGTGSSFTGRSRVQRGGRDAGRVAGGGGGAPTDEQVAVHRMMTQVAMWRARQLTIEQDAESFSVTLPDGVTELLLTDKETRTIPRGGFDVEVKAEAKSDEVKLEWEGPGSAKVTRKFKLKDDGATLEVETQYRNPRMDTDFRFKQIFRRS